MKEKKLIELFKSGDFTIIYWDSGEPTIYQGKWSKEKEFKRDDYETLNKAQIEFPMYNMNGYCPDIVTLLTKALGGKSDSI
jgi:hypothetical protein